MPRASIALLVSLAAHAVFIGPMRWLGTDAPAEVAVPARPIELIPPPPPVEFEPIAIEFVTMPVVGTKTEPTGVATSAPTARTRRRGTPDTAATAAISTGSTATGGTEPPTGDKPPPSGDKPPPTGGLSEDFITDFLANSKPLAPPDDIPGERIGNEIAAAQRELSNATTDAERMVAREKLVALRDERDAEELKPSGGGTYTSDQGSFTAHVNPDGTVDLEDAKNLQIHGLSGTFDLTDWAMRSHGNDPYAANKLAFLDRTRDQRVAIGNRHRKQQLARSAELANNNIRRMLAKLPDVPSRKQALFELWDECAEPGDGNDDIVRGGAAARRMIVATIRSELSGTDAYTAAELTAFNAKRTSKAKFAPYDDE